MRKKKTETEKLHLHRETLRHLQKGLLDKVQGGARTENTCDVSGCIECLPSDNSIC